VDDLNVDCKQCGKRTHVLWAEDPVGMFVNYLRLSRQFADKIYVISHNAHGYDTMFLLRKFLELRWTPQLLIDCTKILSMIVENLHLFGFLNFLPVSLNSMTKSFDLKCKKGYYAHFLNTANNLQYLGTYPKSKFYGADYMSGGERAQFLEWYEE